MYPVCFLSLSLSHSCCHIPKSVPIHSSPLPSLFGPNPGCFLLTQRFLSYPHHFLSQPSFFFFFSKSSCKISFIQSIIGHKTCHITSHKRICVQEMIMSVSAQLLTSSFSRLLFCDNAADTVCNITAHGGVKSHRAHFWSNVSGVKARNSYAWNDVERAENGLDYSVTLSKRARNVQNWLQ